MPKRLFWMTTGYAAGAASSWAVQRRVKREVERVLPEAVRNEVTSRVNAATDKVAAVSDRALERTINSPVTQTANKAVQKVRPDIDLTDRAQARLEQRQQAQLAPEEEPVVQPGLTRLREKARNFRNS